MTQPFIFEKQNQAILVGDGTAPMFKTNFSFSHPGAVDPKRHSVNVIGNIVDRKLHFVKYGDQIKSAVFGLTYDPFVRETVLMPISEYGGTSIYST